MFSWLLPKEGKFFDLFDQHAELTVKAAKELFYLVSGQADIPLTVERIKELEHQADNVTHQCIELLHKIFITPIDREDIYALISNMDDIIDCVDGAARRVAIYKIKEMHPEAAKFAHIVVQSAEYVQRAVKGLRNLKNAPEIQNICYEINKFEYEADIYLSKVIGDLFEDEKDLRTLIKWKEIYESMEEATDRCEDVANVLDGIILEHT